MNVLIVYTHPHHNSLNHAFLERVESGLQSNPSHPVVQVLDLYEEQFDPLLRFDEEHLRRNMDKVPELKKHREQLLWADLLVFIYPIWWGRPPAMLLGYFDRVLATNFAYRYKPNGMPEGLLKNKRAVCISTMKGPTGYPRLILGNVHQNLMKKAVLSFIGIKPVKFFEFGGMETKTGKQERALARIQTYFAGVR